MTTPTLSILALLAIAAASVAIQGFGAALAMSTAAVGVCVVACRWIVSDLAYRKDKLTFDAAETRDLRKHNVERSPTGGTDQ